MEQGKWDEPNLEEASLFVGEGILSQGVLVTTDLTGNMNAYVPYNSERSAWIVMQGTQWNFQKKKQKVDTPGQAHFVFQTGRARACMLRQPMNFVQATS